MSLFQRDFLRRRNSLAIQASCWDVTDLVLSIEDDALWCGRPGCLTIYLSKDSWVVRRSLTTHSISSIDRELLQLYISS